MDGIGCSLPELLSGVWCFAAVTYFLGLDFGPCFIVSFLGRPGRRVPFWYFLLFLRRFRYSGLILPVLFVLGSQVGFGFKFAVPGVAAISPFVFVVVGLRTELGIVVRVLKF